MTQIISRQRIIEAVLQALPDLVIKGVNDGVSGNNGISIGSDTKAVKAIYLVRLNAGSNNIILVKSNGDVLKININTGTTPSITFPSGGTFGEALVPATAVYSSAMIGLVDLRIPTIANASPVAGTIYTTGTGAGMRLYVFDGIGLRQFTPSV